MEKFKSVQIFSDEYLKYCQKMTVEQILKFLEEFSQIHQTQIKKKPKG